MPELFTTLGKWKLSRGYLSALIRGEGGDFMAPGSVNAMVTGQGLTRAFKGPLLLPTLHGSQVFFNTDTTFAGLGSAIIPGEILTYALKNGGADYEVGDTGTIDGGTSLAEYEVLTVDDDGAVLTFSITDGGTGYEVGVDIETSTGGAQPGTGTGFLIDIITISGLAGGSVFKVQDLLCYIGSGQVAFNGSYIPGVSASPTLSLIKKSGGIYAPGALTGPFQAGHAQPAAPIIYAKSPPSSGQISMNAAVAVVIWRVSSITGQVSLMSEPSNALTVEDGSVIVQITALPDTNGQDMWAFGVSKLGFSDLGWFYQLPTSLNGEIFETDLSTIDGHTRSFEISWTNGHLLGQDLAPDKAFPPPPGDFAGSINDVAWLDADGIIYISEPGFIGSMPATNAVFASEPAVSYLKISGNVTARLGKTTIGTLYYVGGSPALEYQVILENQGIEFPQNAAVGAGGRLLAWFGKPSVVESIAEPDFEYSRDVTPDFEGWNSQTAEQPIVVGYDGIGKFECWFWQLKCMAKFVPDDSWCSPIQLVVGDGDNEVIGPVRAAVTYHHRLYICCTDDTELAIYEFDAGTGSVMKIQTSDISRMGFFDNISLIMVEGRADNVDHPIVVEVIKNYDDASPIADTLSTLRATPTGVGTQNFCPRQPNILDVNQHALRITMTSQGGDAGVNTIQTMGPKFDLLNNQCAAGTLDQLITFEPLEDRFVDEDDFLISASSSSGLVVSFAADAGECTLIDNGNGTATVHLTGDVGGCSITASQAGNLVYDPAPNVTQTFDAIKRDQAITFAAISDKATDDADFDISATADSGLTVAFAADGTICTRTDHGDGTATVHLTGLVGLADVTASQAGNGVYNPAPDVVRAFAVGDPGDFPLGGLTNISLCGHAEVQTMVGSDLYMKKTDVDNFTYNRGFCSDNTSVLVNSGTLEFRFGNAMKSCSMGLASPDGNFDRSCANLANYSPFTALAFGLDFQGADVGSPGFLYFIGTNLNESTLFATAAGDIFKVTVQGTVVRIYQNGVLKGTGATDGRALHMKASFLRTDSDLYVRKFSTTIY